MKITDDSPSDTKQEKRFIIKSIDEAYFIFNQEMSDEEKVEHSIVCVCEEDAILVRDALNTATVSDTVSISRECAENALMYASQARVHWQLEIDKGVVGGTEGHNYSFRDAADECSKQLHDALLSTPQGEDNA